MIERIVFIIGHVAVRIAKKGSETILHRGLKKAQTFGRQQSLQKTSRRTLLRESAKHTNEMS